MKKQSRQLASILSAIAFYFYIKQSNGLAFLCISIALIFIAIFSPNVIRPFTKIWLELGNFMHRIISPIFIAVIYYLIFTPLAFITLIFTKNKFKIKKSSDKNESYWVKISDSKYDLEYFKRQF